MWKAMEKFNDQTNDIFVWLIAIYLLIRIVQICVNLVLWIHTRTIITQFKISIVISLMTIIMSVYVIVKTYKRNKEIDKLEIELDQMEETLKLLNS